MPVYDLWQGISLVSARHMNMPSPLQSQDNWI